MTDSGIFETNEYIKKLRKLPSQDKLFIQNKLNTTVYLQLNNHPGSGKAIKSEKVVHLKHGDTESENSDCFTS